MTDSEYVIYNAMPRPEKKCTIQKQIELSRLILDPDYRSIEMDERRRKSDAQSSEERLERLRLAAARI